jgi:hypothetical protein
MDACVHARAVGTHGERLKRSCACLNPPKRTRPPYVTVLKRLRAEAWALCAVAFRFGIGEGDARKGAASPRATRCLRRQDGARAALDVGGTVEKPESDEGQCVQRERRHLWPHGRWT